jgi:large subunit ribosomal protein L18
MKIKNIKIQKRVKRHQKIRSRIKGNSEIPRLSVHKSNRYIQAQLIDDVNGKTMLGLSSRGFKEGNKTEQARRTGSAFAELAVKKHVNRAVFDRGGFRYTGRVRSFAEGVREGGLKL